MPLGIRALGNLARRRHDRFDHCGICRCGDFGLDDMISLPAELFVVDYFRFARQPSRTGDERLWTALFVPLLRFCNHEGGRRIYGTHSELQGCDKISTVTRARDFSALRS